MATKEEIAACLKSHGYSETPHGHFIKDTPKGRSRFKMQATSVRVEEELRGDTGTFWVRKTGGYYKDITIRDGKVIFGKSK
ncbi:MAG: hypothetical protein RR014_02705 [Bilophila sp.]